MREGYGILQIAPPDDELPSHGESTGCSSLFLALVASRATSKGCKVTSGVATGIAAGAPVFDRRSSSPRSAWGNGVVFAFLETIAPFFLHRTLLSALSLKPPPHRPNVDISNGDERTLDGPGCLLWRNHRPSTTTGLYEATEPNAFSFAPR